MRKRLFQTESIPDSERQTRDKYGHQQIGVGAK
jgi:hypothetical protein